MENAETIVNAGASNNFFLVLNLLNYITAGENSVNLWSFNQVSVIARGDRNRCRLALSDRFSSGHQNDARDNDCCRDDLVPSERLIRQQAAEENSHDRVDVPICCHDASGGITQQPGIGDESYPRSEKDQVG